MPSLSQIHRPKKFADVTGQGHVTETLRKEVATGKLGHAFLFCGPRGIGKTTSARILAKALNCEAPQEGEPCNACASCVSANEGKQLDLIEMDAATHNGVDDMRELIDHVRFAPLGAKRKVYVLDEAHMITGPAWNALLKTLEEPPAYAFFIFATTEWHKIPATIASRCQRFEFKRIPDAELAERVKQIAKAEGLKLDGAVADLIVARADGYMRDAETLLGQLASFTTKGNSHITLEEASLVIPVGYRDLAAQLIGLWASRDHAASLAAARQLVDDGISVVSFFEDLIEEVRKLLIASGDTSKPQPFSPGELNDLALMLFERRKDAKSGIDPLFALQLAGTIAANGLLRHATRSPVQVPSPIPPPVPPPASVAEPPVPVPKAQEKTNTNLESGMSLDLNLVRMKWNAIIRAVDEKNHSLPFILKITRPEAVRGTAVVLRFQYAFHHDKIVGDPKNRHMVEESARAILACPSLTLEGVVGEDETRTEARSQDIVTNILKAFGGQVVES